MEKKVRHNKLIERLEQGRVAFAPSVVANGDLEELMAVAESDYDFVMLDMEHQDFDFPTLRHSLQYLLNRKRIAEKGNIQPDVPPLIRIPPSGNEVSQWIIKQTLDTGCYGIVAPHISTVQEARAAVAAMRYPRPNKEAAGQSAVEDQGMRGWFPRHAARYWGLSFKEYYDVVDLWPIDPDGELFLLAIVESQEGVKNLASILKEVKGISGVWAGAGDLSVDLGHAGNQRHPEVEEGVQRILAACLEYNVPCCTVASAADVEQRVEQGFRLITLGTSPSSEALERGRAARARSR